MSAGFTSRLEREGYIALRIEAAGISHVRVIVRRRIHVVVFGPADALQMNRNRSSNRPGSRLHAHDGRLNGVVGAPERLFSVAEFEAMLPAQVLRNRQRELDLSILSHFHFRDRLFLRRKSVAADSASDVRLPEEIQCRAGWKTFTAEHGYGAHRPLDWQ